MSIRTDPPIVGSLSTILLVEDSGFLPFLSRILSSTSISSALEDVHVLGGKGDSFVYSKYDQLVAEGIVADRIIPVLDADDLGKKIGGRFIHKNANVTRFTLDFEMEFTDSDCMFLDHALLFLDNTFGDYGDVEALLTWTSLVQEGRAATLSVPSAGSTLTSILSMAKKRLRDQGDEEKANGMQDPSKVKLAEILANLCLSTGTLPPSLTRLLLIVEAKSNRRSFAGNLSDRMDRFALCKPPLSSEVPGPRPKLGGQILYSPNGIGLKILDLSAGERVLDVPATDDLGWGGWLPDKRIIATARGGNGVVITELNEGQSRYLIRRGVHESFVCWDEKRKRIIVRTGLAKVYAVSDDNTQWHELPAPGYFHCIKRTNFLAWTKNDLGGICVSHIDKLGDAPMTVPGVLRQTHALAWSNDGKELAFVAYDHDQWRGTICAWNSVSNKTRFVMPWAAKPQTLAWSPDDKHLVFQRMDLEGLFLVQVREIPDRTIPPIEQLTKQGGVLTCCSWRA